MTGRQAATHRAQCAEPGCGESGFWTYDRQADRRDHLRRLVESPWRCTRHMNPEAVLSLEHTSREHVLVAARLSHLPAHLFWIAEGEKSGSGFTFGPGFKAFAKDFPEGTRLVVTARIERPHDSLAGADSGALRLMTNLCDCGHLPSEHLPWGGCLGGPLDDPTCDCTERREARKKPACNGQPDCPAADHIDGCLGEPNGNHYRLFPDDDKP